MGKQAAKAEELRFAKAAAEWTAFVLADLVELGRVYDIALATTLAYKQGREGFTQRRQAVAEEALMRRVARLVRLSRLPVGVNPGPALPAVEPVPEAALVVPQAGLVVPGRG